jgi:wyosine [tRNA(Phe)-imidazoG37] synthetase (radical SAM superfamily)
VGKSISVTTKRKAYIPAEKVLEEFNKIYPALKNNIDVITLTGAGEPTLNSDLVTIISEIKKVADHPLALLTNSTLMMDSDVVEVLLMCDIVVPSLDAVTQDVFARVDKPASELKIDDIINAITDFSHKFSGKLYLELLLVKGVNDGIEDLRKFAEVAKKIRYTKVQLGTVFRPPAWEGTKRLTDDELYEAYKFLAKEGLDVEPVKATERQNIRTDVPEQLLNMLRMRPVTMGDIISATGLSEDEVRSFLKAADTIERVHDGEIYYTLR